MDTIQSAVARNASRSPSADPAPASPVPAAEPLAVSPVEAARLLGVSPRTVWQLYNAGELAHRKIGRRVVISVAAIRAFLAA